MRSNADTSCAEAVILIAVFLQVMRDEGESVSEDVCASSDSDEAPYNRSWAELKQFASISNISGWDESSYAPNSKSKRVAAPNHSRLIRSQVINVCGRFRKQNLQKLMQHATERLKLKRNCWIRCSFPSAAFLS